MKTLCLIPARKNSQRLKNKNLNKIKGETLIERTLKLASKISIFDKIILSSDNLKILGLKKKYPKIFFLKRPKNLSTNNIKMSKVIKHTIEFCKKKNKKFDAVIILQPTSPLREKQTIIKAIKKFKKLKPDYLVSIKALKHTEVPEMTFTVLNSRIKKKNIPIKQYKNDRYCLDGGTVFIFKVPGTYSMQGKGAFIKVEFPENIDIDTKQDLILVKKFLK